MDGTLAAIFFVASLTDMALTDCPTACLQPGATTQKLSFQANALIFQEDEIGQEVFLGFDSAKTFGPFQPSFGLSADSKGGLWLGAGAKWTSAGVFDSPVFLEASFMPGLHFSGDGPDIGGSFHFRSAIGIGYAFENGAQVTVLYDHRSNGDRLALNPGLETLGIRYSIPF